MHGVQQTVEKHKNPHKRNMYGNYAPKTPENDEITVKISNCTKKISPKVNNLKPKGRVKPLFTTTRYKVSNNKTTVLRPPRNKTPKLPGYKISQSSPPPPTSTTNTPITHVPVIPTNVNGGTAKVHTSIPTSIPHIHVMPTNVNGGNSKVLPTIPNQISPPQPVLTPTNGMETPR